MATDKLVVVLGATGIQGGGVVDAILHSNKEGKSHFKIRGFTRNLDSEAAKALIARGVEMVQGNFSNEADIENAFRGAYAVFAVTNFWDKEVFGAQNVEAEFKQGKQLADVAAKFGVTHYLWSSLEDVKAISKGELEMIHFTGKHNVQKYVEKLGFKYTTFPALGCYASNFQTHFKPTVDPDGTLVFCVPGLRTDVGVPIVDARDVGHIVTAALNNPEKYGKGNFIPVAHDYITVDQLAKDFEQVTGKRARARYLPYEEAEKVITVREFRESILWFNKYGYYAGRDISDNKKQFPQLKSWKDWLIDSKWNGL